MISNFEEEVNGVILEIKNGESYVDLLPFARCNSRLTDEATLIALGGPKDAIVHLHLHLLPQFLFLPVL